MAVYVHPWNLGFGLIPPTMPYEVVMATMQVGSFSVTEESFPAGANVVHGTTQTIILRDLLFLAGLMGTPAKQNTYAAWGNLLSHYSDLVVDKGEWRLCPEADGWDSTAKGQLMYRLGMGMAGWMLWQHYGIIHIADAEPFIGQALATCDPAFAGAWLKSQKKYGKKGGYKPDLFCLNGQGQAVIVEPKGREGSPGVVKGDKEKGKKQVANVSPQGVPLAPTLGNLVVATTFRISGHTVRSGKGSQVAVVDPEEALDALPVPMSVEDIMLASYAKVLRHVGQEQLALMLELSGEGLLDGDDIREALDVDTLGLAQLPLAVVGDTVIGIEAGVALALLTAPVEPGNGSVYQRVQSAIEFLPSVTDRVLRNARRTVLPNGVVIGSVPRRG